jgi:hypothetical protein
MFGTQQALRRDLKPRVEPESQAIATMRPLNITLRRQVLIGNRLGVTPKMDQIGRTSLKAFRMEAPMRDPLTVLLTIGVFVVGGYAGFVWLADPSTTGHDVTSRPLHAETTLKANVPSEADRTAQESSSKRLAVVNESIAAREANNAEGRSSPTRRDEGADKSNSTVAANSPAQQTDSDQSRATGSSTDQTVSIKAHDAPVGGCMPIGITVQGDLVFPIECRELLEQHRGAYASLEARPEPTPKAPREQAARVEHDPQTVGSVRDHETVGSAREHEPKTIAGESVDDQNALNLPSKGSDVRTAVNPLPRAKFKLATDSTRTIAENGYRRTKVRQFSRADWRRQERFSELLKDPLAFNCMNCLLFGY